MNHLFEKFFELISTSDFFDYYINLCDEVYKSLIFGFTKNQKEPDIVKTIVQSICKTKKINNSETKTYGMFIHGQKSQVKFDYYGNSIQKELGDLIFLLTVINNKKILFEKCTIAQFKKNSNTKTTRSWKIDKEQLYLLSRFPEFNVISGLLKGKTLYLKNTFGHLGSYCLLYSPGDFTYVTAPVLDDLIEGKSSIKHSDFALLNTFHSNCIPFYWLINYPELRYCLEKFFDRHIFLEYEYLKYLLRCLSHSRHCRYLFHHLLLCCSSIYANDVHNFLYNYLTGRIGELIDCDCPFDRFHNEEVKSFISNMFQYIQNEIKKKKKENQPSQNIMEFLGISRQEDLEETIKNISEYIQINSDNNGGKGENYIKEFSDEEGGWGIIHTIINLGENR